MVWILKCLYKFPFFEFSGCKIQKVCKQCGKSVYILAKADVSTSSYKGVKFCVAARGTDVYACAASREPAAQTYTLAPRHKRPRHRRIRPHRASVRYESLPTGYATQKSRMAQRNRVENIEVAYKT